MLTFLCDIYQQIKSLVYFVVFLSFKSGELIVNGLETGFNLLKYCVETLWTVLTVLGEDFGLFLLDLWTHITTGIVTIENIIGALFPTRYVMLIVKALQNLSYGFNVIYNIVFDVIARLIQAITNVAAAVKHLIVLFGSGIWFAVTIIPITLTYVCVSLTYFVGRLIEEIFTAISTTCYNLTVLLQDIYLFVFDVPIESAIGVFIGACLAYVLVKFHVMVYASLRKMSTKAFRAFSKWMNSREFVRRRRTIPSPSTKNGTCIICFERAKCLLTMPCRHLCMCDQCWDRLRQLSSQQEEQCPVCRSLVEYTIHVY